MSGDERRFDIRFETGEDLEEFTRKMGASIVTVTSDPSRPPTIAISHAFKPDGTASYLVLVVGQRRADAVAPDAPPDEV